MATQDTNKGEQNERGKHGSYGFPGALQASKTHAPESADDKSVQSVAWVANEFNLTGDEIETLWNRITALSDSGEETAANATLEQWGDAE